MIVGTCAAVAFTFVTPPLQVPDEVGHFWRAASIAYGHVFPRIGPKGAVAKIPDGYPWLVTVFWRDTAGHPDVKITRAQFRSATQVSLHEEKWVEVVFPGGYTPVPYLPQILIALAARILHLMPAVTFYLGRRANALAYVAIIAAAIRMAPKFGWLFAASALLPMPLYLAASWSPDAMTIASVYFFLAAILSARGTATLAIAGAVVGLCNPAYFLGALIVLAIPAIRWRARAIVLLATAAGVAFSMWNASRAFVPSRPGAHVDAAAQIACIRSTPLIFADALATEARARGRDYIDQTVGRLGLLDVNLPPPVVWIECALLIACAIASTAVSVRARIAAVLTALATIGGIFLASYLGWTPPCASFVDGVQGRYFVPIIPLALLVAAGRVIRSDVLVSRAVTIVATTINMVALILVAARYYV